MDFERIVAGSRVMLILVIVVSILVAIGLFFLFRAITLWYFKINKMLKELEKANGYLARLAAATERGPVPGPMMQQGRPVPPMPQNPVMPGQPAAPNPVMPGVQPAAPVAPTQPVSGTMMLGQNPVKAGGEVPNLAPMPGMTPTAPVEPVAPAVPVKRTCVKCGAVLMDGATFCTECGTKNN